MTRLLTVLALAACSSHGGTPTHPAPGHDAGVPAPATGQTDAECDALIDHLIATQTPADLKLTDAERTKLRTDVRAEALPRCHDLPRRIYDCAIAAPTTDQIAACDGLGKRE